MQKVLSYLPGYQQAQDDLYRRSHETVGQNLQEMGPYALQAVAAGMGPSAGLAGLGGEAATRAAAGATAAGLARADVGDTDAAPAPVP
jgi:hypothetical protein